MAVTTRDTRPPLPGHTIVNFALAAGVWGFGVSFTRAALPLGPEVGPVVPWLVAIALQLLLSVAQSNLRVMGLTLAGWPFVALTLVDVAINMAGLFLTYGGLTSLGDVALYVVRAVLSGVGGWQCLLALGGGVLIAAAPEEMIRIGLKEANRDRSGAYRG